MAFVVVLAAGAAVVLMHNHFATPMPNELNNGRVELSTFDSLTSEEGIAHFAAGLRDTLSHMLTGNGLMGHSYYDDHRSVVSDICDVVTDAERSRQDQGADSWPSGYGSNPSLFANDIHKYLK